MACDLYTVSFLKRNTEHTLGINELTQITNYNHCLTTIACKKDVSASSAEPLSDLTTKLLALRFLHPVGKEQAQRLKTFVHCLPREPTLQTAETTIKHQFVYYLIIILFLSEKCTLIAQACIPSHPHTHVLAFPL